MIGTISSNKDVQFINEDVAKSNKYQKTIISALNWAKQVGRQIIEILFNFMSQDGQDVAVTIMMAMTQSDMWLAVRVISI